MTENENYTAAENDDQEVAGESSLRGWLTLSEAAHITGLPQAYLLRQRITKGDIVSTLYKGEPLFGKVWADKLVRKQIAGRISRQERAAYMAKKNAEKAA